MQIHEAATQYQTHLDQLLACPGSDVVTSDVWRVKTDKVAQGYYLQLETRVGDHPDSGDPETWASEYEEARLITRQRGGRRLFKTLDAVASALQQIGQQKFPLGELQLL